MDVSSSDSVFIFCFQFIRRLDEGGFSKVFLAKGKLPGGPEQLFAIKILKKRSSEKRARFYAAGITLAVQFLHERGILHRDFKFENVLVGSDGHRNIAYFDCRS
jgi:serine/threonine protein kinase